ncbi:MAG: hypothetical protein QMD82_05175, partial [bacterium]|nr:hypothetical protein [bacterium]
LIGISLILLFSPPLCLADKNLVKRRENTVLRSYIVDISRKLLIEKAQIHTLRSLSRLGIETK